MGLSQSCRPTEVAELAADTNFDADQVRELKRKFEVVAKKSKPETAVTRAEFAEALQSAGLAAPKLQLLNRLFELFDQEKNGFVDLQEFVLGLAALTTGDITSRANAVFDLYDIDGAGSVSPPELKLMLSVMDTACLSSTGADVNVKGFVTDVFDKFDVDKTGRLSRAQFAAALADYPGLAKVVS